MKKAFVAAGFLAPILVFTLVIDGCKSSSSTGPSGGGAYSGPTGTVTGVVRAANGVTPIQGARVTVQANYTNMPVDTTDTAGVYTLQGVPVGSQTIVATRGLFRATVTVNVAENQTTTAPPAQLQSTGRLGYVVGSFDRIQDIIGDTLGYAMEEVDADSLGFAAVLSRYRAIFLNCGMDYGFLDVDTNAAQTLRNYVSGGGSLYVSDWAQEVVRRMFPSDVRGFQRIGQSQVIHGRVVDAGLRAFIAKDSVQINYDLGSWEILDTLSTRPRILLRGDYSTYSGPHIDKPLAILIDHGQGRVVYTTFHNEANVTRDAVEVLTYFLFIL
jgi:hypothetical protein